MPSNYLTYGKPDQVFNYPEGSSYLDHWASEQLYKVKQNDVLWIVTLENIRKLILIGWLQVDQVVDRSTAEKFFGSSDLYEASYHVIANPDLAEPIQYIDITDLALELRFQSATGKDRLSYLNGRFDPMQLRTMRLLTEESVHLLKGVWYGQKFLPHSTLEILESSEDEMTYQEGRIQLRTRQERERNRVLILQAKRRFRQLHGHLYCEACGFDFAEIYGEIGEDYIEAHHSTPISQFDEDHETNIDDLVMLCANCHRMIHQRNPPLSLTELKQIVSGK